MRWPWLKQKSDRSRCIGVELHNGQAFAVLRDATGVIQSFQPEVGEQGIEALNRWLDQHQLHNLAVTISLDQRDYELHLVEAPNVPDDELSDALRFRLKDMVTQPIESKALQAFRLPQDAYRGRMDMAFAAVIDRSCIEQLVKWAQQQQLYLSEITIPELSILQLVAAMEPETSVGVLRLDNKEGVFYLFQQGGLYMTRAIGVGTDDLGLSDTQDGELTLETDSRLENLALEVQRSMDYFESQLGMGSVGQIWAMVPDDIEMDTVLPELEQAVNTPIRTLALDSAFNRMPAPSSLTASLATALGGSLSYELVG
jgi:MSHA biogenesis protein MshI